MATKRLLFDFHQLTKSRCFLCGMRLDDSNRSDEHVFPKWLLRAAGLWNHKVTLLNGTTLPYRQLTIPSCKACNTGTLSLLEREIGTAIKKGYGAFCRVHPYRVMQWCAKLLCGLLTKEYNLLTDRQRQSAGRIATRPMLEVASVLHAFTQTLRFPCEITTGMPASIFVVRLHKYAGDADFFFMDSCFLGSRAEENLIEFSPSFALRFNGIGIICLFLDNAQQQLGGGSDCVKAYEKFPLHPLQFVELAVMSFYKHSLFNFEESKYVFVEQWEPPKLTVAWDPPQPMTRKAWDGDEFAQMLSDIRAKAYPVPDQMPEMPPGRIYSYLMNGDGTPKFMTKMGRVSKRRVNRPVDAVDAEPVLSTTPGPQEKSN